jgi:hypothetical protein
MVLNLTAKGDVQTRALRAQLDASGFPVARTEIRRLNALRDACDTAVTRMKASEGGEAARDIDTLFRELIGTRLMSVPKRAGKAGDAKKVENG